MEFPKENMADALSQMEERETEGSKRSIVIKVIGAGVFLPF